MPKVNPRIMVWARETAGLSEADAAQKIGLRAAHEVDAIARLARLEDGSDEPTRVTLREMARVYRRPLLTFYLAQPPLKGDRGEDFRTLVDRDEDQDALLDALIRDVSARQAMVRSILEDEEDSDPLTFVGSSSVRNGIDACVASIVSTLAFSLADFRAEPRPADAFAFLRRAAEAAGVFVLLKGDMGSHHSAISLGTFRGFALADPIAPFIVINDRDAEAAWSFTLAHELAHIWLGRTGVSGGPESILEVERFCNDVASELLLPSEEIRSLQIDYESVDELLGIVSELAKQRKVSGSMVAYRLLRADAISRREWLEVSRKLRDFWLERRADQRLKASNSSGGPNFYTVRRHRLGDALIDFAARWCREGSLSTSEAGKVLGVKPKQVGKLLGWA